ncbi:MAG: hypothetical protein LBB23_01960 [Rickettsiales bacterium]|jgi:hypothetical protein|nr:hypothetical protein [Rickettsiales bacterium]
MLRVTLILILVAAIFSPARASLIDNINIEISDNEFAGKVRKALRLIEDTDNKWVLELMAQENMRVIKSDIGQYNYKNPNEFGIHESGYNDVEDDIKDLHNTTVHEMIHKCQDLNAGFSNIFNKFGHGSNLAFFYFFVELEAYAKTRDITGNYSNPINSYGSGNFYEPIAKLQYSERNRSGRRTAVDEVAFDALFPDCAEDAKSCLDALDDENTEMDEILTKIGQTCGAPEYNQAFGAETLAAAKEKFGNWLDAEEIKYYSALDKKLQIQEDLKGKLKRKQKKELTKKLETLDAMFLQ